MIIRFNERPTAPQHTPADEDLEHRLVNFLQSRHVPDSDNLQVEAHGGTVLVSGRLQSRRAKWLCIECCRRVAGVIELVDSVEAPAHYPALPPQSSVDGR